MGRTGDFLQLYARMFSAFKFLDVTKTLQDVQKYTESLSRHRNVILVGFVDDRVVLLTHRGRRTVELSDTTETMLSLTELLLEGHQCARCLSDFAGNSFSVYYCCSHCNYALCMSCIGPVEVREGRCWCGQGPLHCSYEDVAHPALKVERTWLDMVRAVVRIC